MAGGIDDSGTSAAGGPGAAARAGTSPRGPRALGVPRGLRRRLPPAGVLPLALALAACGTPQERCIHAATQEVRVVDGLIAGLRADLARGYAIETYPTTEMRWLHCYRPAGPVPPGGGPRPMVSSMCFEPVPVTATRPRAIDPGAERRKLDGLLARRPALLRTAEAETAACRARFPQ